MKFLLLFLTLTSFSHEFHNFSSAREGYARRAVTLSTNVINHMLDSRTELIRILERFGFSGDDEFRLLEDKLECVQEKLQESELTFKFRNELHRYRGACDYIAYTDPIFSYLPFQNETVFICPKFLMSGWLEYQRAGTIIHEVSHLCGTDDYIGEDEIPPSRLRDVPYHLDWGNDAYLIGGLSRMFMHENMDEYREYFY